MKIALYFSLALLVSGEVFAQSAATGNATSAAVGTQAAPQAATPTLRMVANITTQERGRPYGEVMCDEGGNVYTRVPDDGSSQASLHAPVHKLNADGSLSSTFEIANAALDASLHDFFVTSDGKVYLVAWGQTHGEPGWHAYALQFTANGELKSTVQINTKQHIFPSHIAAFESGEILVTGKQGEKENTPFTGVFTASGKLIKEIFEPEDEELGRRAELGDADVVHGSGSGNDAVDLGAAAGGPDGNVYLMRSTSPALIFAVTARGEVVRKFPVSTGDPLMFPVRLQSFPGGIAVLFSRSGFGRVLKVVDSEGNPIATYGLDRGLTVGDFACYAPPAFTFLGNDDGFMHLYKLEQK
jgi:hypothetical protein